jgi:hypothetical protein
MAKKKSSKPRRATKASGRPGGSAPESRMQRANTYEEMAAYLLNLFKAEFGLDRVEPKQPLPGRSGARWTIDAKGVKVQGGGIIVVECRRKGRDGVTQEEAAALAFRITDLGANGGIFVSPIGLQEGARKVADANNILSVVLDPNSTPESFSITFLGKFKAGGIIPLFLKAEEGPEGVEGDTSPSNRDR